MVSLSYARDMACAPWGDEGTCLAAVWRHADCPLLRHLPRCPTRLLIPLVFLHVDAAVDSEGDALLREQRSLIGKVRCEASCMVDDSVARIVPIAIRLAQHRPDQARVFLPADKARNLAV